MIKSETILTRRLETMPLITGSALQASFNEHVRPLLDAVDRLRAMSVTDEGIQLPTIVVVGDQSSGKSSVLESLAGVDLPRGQGIVTRVPLILRLQSSTKDGGDSQISIAYESKQFTIREDEILHAVDAATIELAGNGKNIVNKPITLHIKKPDAPDLTMVDLPGITRVPVHGQPDDIYEQITQMIQQYIAPKESIILNVLSASVDFPTCESIRMSRSADKDGERTLAVVTKVDRSPEGLYEKVTTDAVNIGLGYICVRNRTPDEGSHKEARVREQELFDTHPLLMSFPKDMVGIPALARRLMQIQADSIKRCLPRLVKQIECALSSKRKDIDKFPRQPADAASAGTVYVKVSQRIRLALEKLMAGDLTEFPRDNHMHFTARVHEMFNKFSAKLFSSGCEYLTSDGSNILEELLNEAKGVNLPNFLQHSVFQYLVSQEIDQVNGPCMRLVSDVHDHAMQVIFPVIDKYTEGYQKLRSMYKKKMQAVLSRSRQSCEEFVRRKLDKETKIVFTYNEQYMRTIIQIHAKSANTDEASAAEGSTRFPLFEMNLKDPSSSSSSDMTFQEMKISFVAYWKVVQNRLADEIPLEIRYAVEKAVLEELQEEILQSLVSSPKALLEMLAEDPQLHSKRERIRHSIDVLEKCYAVVMEIASPSLPNAS